MAVFAVVRAAVLASLAVSAGAARLARSKNALEQRANPIRRVVELLKAMQVKVAEEGKKEDELYEKFSCYCKTGKGDLGSAIAMAEDKMPKVTAAIEGAKSKKAQTDSDVSKAKADRSEGKEALATAKSLRAKENAAYGKLSSDFQTDLSALTAAIAAIEKGMAGSFLQTQAAGTLRRLAVDVDMSSVDRDVLTAFLSQAQEYAPKSGQIVGILKEMKDTMGKDLADATSTEEQSIKEFNALSAAKTSQIEALTKEIESKLEVSGNLAVEIVNLEEDLDDTTKTYTEDKKFLSDLNAGCDTKQQEWEERSATRATELVALADTIKILNSDDALELFKKTLPSPTLLQTLVSSREASGNARDALGAARRADPRVALISMALRGGAKSFDKVIKMIDSMVALLGEEQTSDDTKKAYCEKELDTEEDTKKVLETKGSDLEKSIADTKESISTLADEIAALLAGIKELDGQVKEATETREEENAFWKKTMQEDNAAKDVLNMAKNRLAKFYAPKMYQPPAKVERSTMGRISEEMSLAQHAANPGPPPATWGAYQNKNEEHGGVVAMMDLLIADLDKEIAQMTTDEKEAQSEYETFMANAGDKRAADSKSTEQKTNEKAQLEAAQLRLEQEHKGTMQELYNTEMLIKDLHLSCDWLLANFEVRKEARLGEVDSLKKAKAVLSGADYSLTQSALRGVRQ